MRGATMRTVCLCVLGPARGTPPLDPPSVADSNNLITVPFSYFYNEIILFHTLIRIQPADDINLQGQKVWKTTIKAYILEMGSETMKKQCKSIHFEVSAP